REKAFRITSSDGDTGYGEIARELAPYPRPSDGRKGPWNPTTVKQMFQSHALRGVQEMFGIEWNVLPPVLDEDEYWQLQRSLRDRSDMFNIGGSALGSGEAHLLADFLRCWCKERVGWQHDGHGYHRYACEALRTAREDYSRPHVTILASRIH